MSYTLLGGQINYVDEEESFDVDLAYDRASPPRQVVGKVTLYLSEQDVVCEIDLRGLYVSFTQWEPTLEERLLAAAHQIADLLHEEGLDVHDFKEIVFAALIRFEEERLKTGETPDLYDRLDNIYHKLGGMD